MQTYYRSKKVVVARKMEQQSLLVINMEHGWSSGNYHGGLVLLIAEINTRNEGKRESHGNVAFALGMKGWVMGKAQQLWKKTNQIYFSMCISQMIS